MKTLLMTAALAALVAPLLAGCAENPTADGQKVARDDHDAPIGSYIPKKHGGTSSAQTLDKQQVENAQMINAGTNNGR